MSEYTERFTHAGLEVELWYDMDCDSPRENCNGALFMLDGHRRYTLIREGDISLQEYESLTELRTAHPEILAMAPVWMYDHSGLSFSLGSFAMDQQQWDSGIVGIAYVTAESLRDGWGDEIPAEDRLLEIIEIELREYDAWQSGDCWGYTILGSDEPSCGGFIGKEYALEEARMAAEWESRHRQERLGQELADEIESIIRADLALSLSA